MIQGTGSGVGKSTLVAGLARAFLRRGLRVQPFKPQNMSNNAAVTGDGGEIGRAQAVQARAARVTPSIHMNPLLLKPETDRGAQIILQGRSIGHASALDYAKRKLEFLPKVLESFSYLEKEADLILVEGAGSPAEINLRANDIANMGFASAAQVPVVIAGDIDRGGVIASLIGTHAVLTPADRSHIKAFIINKFRGDPRLFEGGIDAITRLTSWPSLGVVPWLPAAAFLPAEDSASMNRPDAVAKKFKIAVPTLARIANFDDLDPLGLEPNVELLFVRAGEALPGDADLVILPGSKSTMGDLSFFREQGWDIDLQAHVRRGGHVLGLCGGYQMLGLSIEDPDGTDGAPGSIEGLGLLSVSTRMLPDKQTRHITGRHCLTGAVVSGYEIHLGRTEGADCTKPMLTIEDQPDGATSPDGKVQGTYVHGLFTSDDFRKQWLAGFGVASDLAYDSQVESALDALADHLEAHLDLDRLLKIARERQTNKASAA
jgi:adenosylcobyric acid synthase